MNLIIICNYEICSPPNPKQSKEGNGNTTAKNQYMQQCFDGEFLISRNHNIHIKFELTYPISGLQS